MSEVAKLEHDLLLFLGAVIYVIVVIFIPKLLKEKGVISGYIARKIIHSFAGLSVFISPYMYYPILAVTLGLASIVMTLFSSQKSRIHQLKKLYEAIREDEEMKAGYLQGPFAYSLAITILIFIFVFFPDKYYIPIAAILVMMFADSTAAIVGRRWGRHFIYIRWVGSKRTWEGSIAFMIIAFLCSLTIFSFFGRLVPGFSQILTIGQIIFLSLVMSVLSAGLELISPSKFDDLVIPLGSTVLVSLIALLTGIW
jgi:dolichol kinase